MKRSELVNDVLRWLIAVIVSIALIAVSTLAYNRFKPAEPDQTLIGSAQGMLSEVTVTLGLKDGKILSAEATEGGETPELGGAAVTHFNDVYLPTLVGKTLADIDVNAIDTVSGATVTSNAFIGALAQAAGIEVPAAETAEEPVAEEATETPVEEAAAEEATEATAEEPAEAASVEADETLTGTAQGMLSEITVTIGLKDGVIVSAEATEGGETPELGGEAIKHFNADYLSTLIGKTAADIDTAAIDVVAGATVTSNAFIDALKQAIGATEEAPAEEATTEEATEEPSATEETTEEPAEEPAAETAEEPAEAASVEADETLTGTAQGMLSEITVTIGLKDGVIVSAEATEGGETPELGGEAIKHFNTDYLPTLIGKTTADIDTAAIDTVTGATVTSTAFIDAMKQAIGTTEEAPAEETVAEAATETAATTTAAMPQPKENGVVASEDWAELYPDEVNSYNANSENNYTVSYLEEDPYLVDIYEGYGFAKDYNSAQGHPYCLEDVQGTARPHALANCLTCKTADYTVLVNSMGTDAYSLNFEDVVGDMSENVGCYTCHENTPGQMTVTHDYIINGLGDNMSSVDATVLSCGQCHIEYYFDPETKATSIPYTDVASMSPDAILEYYNEMGFSDWTQESTGTGMLKAQHPEMETFLGEGSKHAAFGMTCASCHMETVTKDDGTTYTSHDLVSPLDSETILATCAACHKDTDMAEKVHTLQATITARETEVGNDLAALKNNLAAAVASGDYTEDELNEIRSLYRNAQWYFDYDYVENSEGAHNSTMANYCLDKSAELIEQATALFKDSKAAA